MNSGSLYSNSLNDARIYWYNIVKQYLEDNNIPWTTWDYKGGFGLFKKGSNELFEHDLNLPLLQSLGFTLPSQTPFSIKPDSTGVIMYSDFVGHGINDGSYSSGNINFDSTDLLNNGIIVFIGMVSASTTPLYLTLIRTRDFSKLISKSFAIDFMVRGNLPGMKFDIRFD